jgi:hypothetical protein
MTFKYIGVGGIIEDTRCGPVAPTGPFMNRPGPIAPGLVHSWMDRSIHEQTV